jgi:hypothetical protein
MKKNSKGEKFAINKIKLLGLSILIALLSFTMAGCSTTPKYTFVETDVSAAIFRSANEAMVSGRRGRGVNVGALTANLSSRFRGLEVVNVDMMTITVRYLDKLYSIQCSMTHITMPINTGYFIMHTEVPGNASTVHQIIAVNEMIRGEYDPSGMSTSMSTGLALMEGGAGLPTSVRLNYNKELTEEFSLRLGGFYQWSSLFSPAMFRSAGGLDVSLFYKLPTKPLWFPYLRATYALHDRFFLESPESQGNGLGIGLGIEFGNNHFVWEQYRWYVEFMHDFRGYVVTDYWDDTKKSKYIRSINVGMTFLW